MNEGHYKNLVADLMVNIMYGKTERDGFGILLTKDNIEDYLAKRQAEYEELKQEYAIQAVHNKISSLTNNLDKMYMDRLSGLLTETDFERMYQRMKIERTTLEEKLKELERLKESPISSDTLSKELVQRFLQSAYTSRELLVSLIERIELTETKQIIIKFRFPELEAIS